MSKRKDTGPLAVRSTVARQAWMRNGAGPMADRRKVRGGKAGAKRQAIREASA